MSVNPISRGTVHSCGAGESGPHRDGSQSADARRAPAGHPARPDESWAFATVPPPDGDAVRSHMEPARLREVLDRLQTGFYDGHDVRRQIAERVAAELHFAV